MTARQLGYGFEDYAKLPHLSASRAKVLRAESPAHLKAILDGLVERKTKPMDVGTILHALILGKGAGFAVSEGFRTKKGDLSMNWLSGEAKAFKEQAEADGKTALLTTELDAYQKTATILKEKITRILHEKYGGMDFAAGNTEEPWEWEEDGIMCKCRLDWRFEATIIDVKTSYSANDTRLPKIAHDNLWGLQEAAYTNCVEAISDDYVGRARMLFAICECKPPYSVVIRELDGTLRTIGDQDWEAAKRTWKRCIESGYWDDYPESGVIEAPPWAMNRLLERQTIEEMNTEDLEAWKDGTPNAAF